MSGTSAPEKSSLWSDGRSVRAAIRYLRVSVTDRCDLRCFYCMSEDMTFLPKADLLTLEELDRLCSAFIAKGVRKLRLTGGEPLVRRNVMSLVRSLSRHLEDGRARRADADHQRLAARALRRASSPIAACAASTCRWTRSMRTNSAPSPAGAISTRCLPASRRRAPPALRVKINAVALKNLNEDEIPDADDVGARQGHGADADRGDADGRSRRRPHRPVRAAVAAARAAGTAVHADRSRRRAPAALPAMCASAETGGKLGFITPMTHNFCESCNRVRITCTGTLHTCLGHEDASDLRKPLRASAGRRSARRRDRSRHWAEAQGPRLHHRPPAQPPERQPPHERHRRLIFQQLTGVYST